MAKFCLFSLSLLSDFVRSVNSCVCVCKNERKRVKEGGRDRDRDSECVRVHVYVRPPVCVLGEQSSDELPCQRPRLVHTSASEIPLLLLCWLTIRSPQHHNSHSSSKRLAGPNGNVIFQIKDGSALMRGGVMGGV